MPVIFLIIFFIFSNLSASHSEEYYSYESSSDKVVCGFSLLESKLEFRDNMNTQLKNEIENRHLDVNRCRKLFDLTEVLLEKKVQKIVKFLEINNSIIIKTEINGVLKIDFILDTGASDTVIPQDVVGALLLTGTLKQSDFRGDTTASLADGTIIPSKHFILKKITIGNQDFYDVECLVVNKGSPLLLGYNVIKKLNEIKIDFYNKIISFN